MTDLISAKIITFNRAEKLRALLQTWNSSQLKAISLEILDNASTDSTSETIKSAQRDNPNVSTLRHVKNIGAVGNLLRAYERFETEYCWVLCDDDNLDAEGVPSLFKALAAKPDIILVASVGVTSAISDFFGSFRQYVDQGAAFFVQCSFLPGLIFRRKFIGQTTMYRCYKAASCLYPHIVLLDDIYQCAETVAVLDRPLVKRIHNNDIESGEIYWLFEILRPVQYVSRASRTEWIIQFLSYVRQDSPFKCLKAAVYA